MTPCWLPVRVGPHTHYVNFAWVRRLEPLPGGRTRLHWARRHLDVDEHPYVLTTILGLRLLGAGPSAPREAAGR